LLEKAGIPSCTVTSTPFAFKTRREVEAQGYPALPILVLPHPIGQLPDAEMRRIADESFEEVHFTLTAPVDRVTAAYTNQTVSRTFPVAPKQGEVAPVRS